MKEQMPVVAETAGSKDERDNWHPRVFVCVFTLSCYCPELAGDILRLW
jgi:hypothetical protein